MALLGLAAAAALLLVAMAWQAPASGSGRIEVRVDGPDGAIWNGTVEVTDATVLSALLAAADAGAFAVKVSGTGDQAFVVAIAGHANEGLGGWCYAVWDDGWVHPPVSAGAWGLEDGALVWWQYLPEGCP